ncbi:antibiotic biosynthesis monooxygenase [Herbaspirillum sp. HC18]|nr:antibiotic biosynthesis monooxygenase [Herbaspirillum sp. HC18]
MSDFFLLATLYARPDRAEELRNKLIALVEPSRKDDGNLRYELFADQNDPRRFIFIEHWSNEEAQKKHHTETDHIRRFEEQKGELVEKVELFYKMAAIA